MRAWGQRRGRARVVWPGSEAVLGSGVGIRAGWRVSGAASLRSAAVAQRAGGSGAASGRACALKCLRAQDRGGRARERERGERKRLERERESQHFDLIQTQNFPRELEKF